MAGHRLLRTPLCGMLCPSITGGWDFPAGSCDKPVGHRGPHRTYDELTEETVYYNDGTAQWLIEPEDPRVEMLRQACDL